jgi:hypothetical protein
MMHVHKFNATLLRRRGRCSCGAWAKWSTRERRWGDPVTHAPRAKGLETRLRKFHDPNVPYPAEFVPPVERIYPPQREPDTTPDVTQVLAGQRRREGER